MGSKFGWPRRLGRVIVICGMVGGTVTALTPLAQAGTGGTEFVNAATGVDTGTCRLQAHPCQTITYALTQNTGDTTINVAAGQYPAQLTITAPVTIVGAGTSASTGTVINPSVLASTDTDPNHATSPYPIIDVNGATNVKLHNLAVDGTAAQSQFSSCAQNPMGVYYHNASGKMSSVAVTNIQESGTLFGCQSGLGVYVASDTGMNSSVTMGKMTVSGYQKNGVTCRDAGTSCTLTGSHITGVGPTSGNAENGFEGYGVASVTVTNDTVTGDSYTGGGSNQATGLLILDVGTVSATHNHLSSNDINGYFSTDGSGPSAGTWTISSNTVTHATSPGIAGYGDGIVLDSTVNTVTVSANTVKTSAEYGIALYGASNATVSGNTVSKNKSDGIYIGGPGSTLPTSGGNGPDAISSNTVASNHGNGINADTNSTGDTFTSNIANFNALFDLKDAGMLNMWMGNTCQPAHDSSPAGLC